MKFNFNMILKLIEILECEFFNSKLYDEFIAMNEVKDFILHEKQLGRNTDIQTLKQQLQNTIAGSKDLFECNGFNIVKQYIKQLKTEIDRLQKDEKVIIERIFNKIDRYCPVERLNDITLFFYGGGLDYGYSNECDMTHVNIGSLADKMRFLEDIIAHECYHARVRMGDILDYDFSKERYLDTLMFHILEEGIATLIQFGYPKAYEEFAFITKDYFNNTDLYFNNLNRCIMEIELNNNYSLDIINDYFYNSIPNYVVGYKIGEVLFKHGGRELLNLWSIDGNYLSCFKKFIHILREKNQATGFSSDVEDYLLSLCECSHKNTMI